MTVLPFNTSYNAAEEIQRAVLFVVIHAEKLVDTFQQQRRYRKTVNALNSLDSRCLADIGLDKADIEPVAKSLFK
ncbi:DUF1127 domain-containing protein [Sneathiella sp.]|jgi:uncharacterized protein YjiS (DUF1127 family)|uniref:DUF1127 domain-containing protein n=1 Tax=Sneathiella sp. TaxID=1964365 RepID=UPI0039E2B8A7